jgi:hypothetical protein
VKFLKLIESIGLNGWFVEPFTDRFGASQSVSWLLFQCGHAAVNSQKLAESLVQWVMRVNIIRPNFGSTSQKAAS